MKSVYHRHTNIQKSNLQRKEATRSKSILHANHTSLKMYNTSLRKTLAYNFGFHGFWRIKENNWGVGELYEVMDVSYYHHFSNQSILYFIH